MTTARPIDSAEARRIGVLIGDPFVSAGHPLTCNGGNPNCGDRHDVEVRMLLDEARNMLVCPRCGREQRLPSGDVVPLDVDDFSYYGDPADLEEQCNCGCDGDCA